MLRTAECDCDLAVLNKVGIQLLGRMFSVLESKLIENEYDSVIDLHIKAGEALHKMMKKSSGKFGFDIDDVVVKKFIANGYKKIVFKAEVIDKYCTKFEVIFV